jgi:predicted metal-dependent peptidase
MRRIVSDRVPVAGVRIKNHIELFINLKEFSKFPLEERVSVLKHECEHLLRNHIPRAKELAPEVYGDSEGVDSLINSLKHKALNISADCAINGMLENLPKNSIFPSLFDLKNGETMEWYLNQLKDNEKAKYLMEIDGHSLWAESDGDKDILREKIKQAVNKAANKTRAAGKMTSDHELLVSNLNAKSEINWREQIKRFVAKSIESQIESSKKKRNRRYGIMYPGTIKIEDLHIGVAIDTSGSVSDEALKQFMVEIGQIAKYAKVTVAEADTEIKNYYIYKPKKEYKISGRGGTAYQPAFDFFNEEEIDAMIYFGDMDCYDKEEIKKPKYSVLWAIVGQQKPPAQFGSKLYVKIK